jgi:hypothetical protein
MDCGVRWQFLAAVLQFRKAAIAAASKRVAFSKMAAASVAADQGNESTNIFKKRCN